MPSRTLKKQRKKERKKEKQNSIHQVFSNNCLWLELFPKLAPGGERNNTLVDMTSLQQSICFCFISEVQE